MRHTWIGHPLTVAALVVLVVNDHVLKQAWPGLVTGKLSDVAGLVLLPALLDLVVRNAVVSIAVTGVGFTLVKATSTGAWLASEALTSLAGPSVVLADPADLLALPALWVAWWAYRHQVPVRKAVVFLLVPPTVLAVAATSIAPWDWPYTAYAVESDGDEIVVHTSGGYGHGYDRIVYRTRDGLTWDKWIQHERVSGESHACRGATCYRIVPGHLRVEESRAGVWTTAWEISDATRDRLFRAYPERNTFRTNIDPKEPVESMSVAVTERLVVVANGADGIALRDVRGTWHRLGLGPDGFDPARALPMTVPGRYDVAAPVGFAAAAAALLVLFAGAREPLILIGGTMLVGGLWLSYLTAESTLLAVPFLALLFLLFPGAGLLGFGYSRARPPWPLPVLSLLAGLLAGAVAWAPYAAWGGGLLGLYSDAKDLAVTAFLLVTLAGMAASFKASAGRSA
ncbi:hypothetical protein [Herbidospora cretacea]|uniref:hypothetical protein n=1 Tax=Herbidospora cretacea TaxID=28444 RepID=UPI000A8B8650|nr:hypothetical protein [Herbidospora cretacea]